MDYYDDTKTAVSYIEKDFVDINSTKTDVDEFWNTFKEQCTTSGTFKN